MALSRLLTLPAEIRALIFQFAVTADNTVVTFLLDNYQRDSYSQATQPALTRVSRQVRAESLPIYYECNDFVLHTEKAQDAYRWLRCNSLHLGMLRRISFWLRYVPLANDRASSQGAMSVSVRRPKKYDPWKVDDDWQWITVVRKPAELKGDVKFLHEKLVDLVSSISREAAGPDDYSGLMSDLRLFYIQEKMS